MASSEVPKGLQDPRGSLGQQRVMFSELVGWGARVAVEIYRDRREGWLKDEIYSRVTELDRIAEKFVLHSTFILQDQVLNLAARQDPSRTLTTGIS